MITVLAFGLAVFFTVSFSTPVFSMGGRPVAMDKEFAQPEQVVEVRVDGLACPYCAYGLEKKLKSTGALAQYDVDLKSGIVKIVYREGHKLSESELKRAVQEAGFEYKGLVTKK